MIKLKQEIIDGEKYVIIGSRYYRFEEEIRGVRDKFWLIQEKSKYIKEHLKYKNILFKYNLNDVSCENWGEIYASRIARQIGVPCVDYHLATYEEDGVVSQGVMCGTYKHNEKEIELTVYDIQTRETEDVKNINTVDDIVENLMTIVPNKDQKFYHSYLRNQLIKQCIFDFLLAQTDRHWFNTTFLLYTEHGVFNIRKSECYDNGCIAILKRKYSAIEGITREIKTQGNNSKRLNDLLQHYTPMMGIKTSTVEINKQKIDYDNKKLKVKKDRRNIFLDELTEEILNNPEIALFYKDLKKYLNVPLVTNLLKKEGTPAPLAVAEFVELLCNYQLNIIDNLIHEKIKNSHKTEEEEMSL